ncbi:hypothetical protein TREMEDRAFT_61172 [Tremella mesenterica DSM 1558]|uniref:uncharacterized protein n=1 Tax=Tremella mesenterica (strain ATCC 24925 / CBS 8224 / DSM 1558 / NBRC 9311 / NRRL Y-6157 / RJB 2259-6 / UBC 559-6) TaxID=578456 RepID=UPI0003F4A545|nr:uncharacterized protein TREMEDRAFT_61172 [Tremella mesenterica DSM 1558]EIW70664.1 hypothetical protein TREMEDRAFT_61172 [Tremella mesenterica DSM 1558]
MPKPTFLQTVLRKPTRSYATPGYNPWADQEDEYDPEPFPSRYNPRVDNGVFLGYRDTSQPGSSHLPSPASSSFVRNRKTSRSTISEPVTEVGTDRTAGTRFPKPVKRVQEHLTLTPQGEIILTPLQRDVSSINDGTVKKKKKRKPRIESEAQSVISNTMRTNSPAPTIMTIKHTATRVEKRKQEINQQSVMNVWNESLSTENTGSLVLHQQRLRDAGESSSSLSSPVPPFSPAPRQTPTPDDLPPRSSSLDKDKSVDTPPSSVSSLPAKPNQELHPSPPESYRQPQGFSEIKTSRPKPIVVIPPVESDTEEEETFYTPRASLDQRPMSFFQPSTSARFSTLSSVQESTPIPASMIPPPSFSLQPPTPAPLVNPETSPFELPSARFGDPEPVDTPTRSRPITTTVEMPASPPADGMADDAHSASGEIGSDEDEESERLGGPNQHLRGSHSRNTSYSRRSSSALDSHPASVGFPASASEGRTSKRSSKAYSDFVVIPRRFSAPLDDQSYQASAYEPSIRSAQSGRSVASGLGKGGWAAAQASAQSRSGATTPVMYMPSHANGGWGNLQELQGGSAPVPPPKKSKFTPLPVGALPATFDRLTNGSRLGNGSQSLGESQDGGLRVASRSGSSLSEYSQVSYHPEIRPSRSYTIDQVQSDQRPSFDGVTLERPLEDDLVEDPSDSEEEYDQLPRPSRSYIVSIVSEDHQIDPLAPTRRVQSPDSIPEDAYLPAPPSPTSKPLSISEHIPRRSSSSAESRRESFNSVPFPSRRPSSSLDRPSRPLSPLSPTMLPISRPMSSMSISTRAQSPTPSQRIGFEPPSFLDPDALTLLPEMTIQDSDKTYEPSFPRPISRTARRTQSVFGNLTLGARSSADDSEEADQVPELPVRRSKSVNAFRMGTWEGSNHGESVLMNSHGRDMEPLGYSSLILPSGAYKPSDPSRFIHSIDYRSLRMPQSTMAAITLSTLPIHSTPLHLRNQLPPPIDFSSHLKPPTKVNSGQILVQVYAVAIDEFDVKILESKSRNDIGRWVPGRSFVGRCLKTSSEEVEIVRGELIMGLMDLKKSGCLTEYILIDRRRISKTPFPTFLSLEQLALLPLHGIPAIRISRTHLIKHSLAIVSEAHRGIGALVCQLLARSGVAVTATIVGGDGHYEAQMKCMKNGARGVLTGSLASVLSGFEESSWDFIFDSTGGLGVEGAKRVLRDGGSFASISSPFPSPTSPPPIPRRTSAFKSLFTKRKDSKYINLLPVSPAGTGEPEVDSSGMDIRDVLEDELIPFLSPVSEGSVVFEKAREVFRSPGSGMVVRIIN